MNVEERFDLHGHDDEKLRLSAIEERSKSILARHEVVGVASSCSVSERGRTRRQIENDAVEAEFSFDFRASPLLLTRQ